MKMKAEMVITTFETTFSHKKHKMYQNIKENFDFDLGVEAHYKRPGVICH